MEWSAGSKQTVSVGNGLPQREAAPKAEELIMKGIGTSFKLARLAQVIGEPSPLNIAITNLSYVPPEKYALNGIPESFVLAVATALVRFDAPVDVLAKSLLGERRSELLSAVQKEGSFTINSSLTVEGSRGCLRIRDEKDKAQIYIKTPFASSESC
jgi:hypothetical protein